MSFVGYDGKKIVQHHTSLRGIEGNAFLDIAENIVPCLNITKYYGHMTIHKSLINEFLLVIAVQNSKHSYKIVKNFSILNQFDPLYISNSGSFVLYIYRTICLLNYASPIKLYFINIKFLRN